MMMNRRFRLRTRPTGAFEPNVLELAKEDIPSPGPGQVLVKNLYLSVDPSSRVWMEERESYMPPIALGDVMRGAGLGEVVDSKNPAFPRGARVLGLLNWQDYALIGPTDLYPPITVPKLPFVSLPSLLSALGITGLTAYFGMLDVGRPKRGETVVVSAAAGAVGNIAGQIAKLRGARVVGIAGTPEKCRWLTEELGFDAAICRRDPSFREELARACPRGIDLDFENAGGEIMETVFDHLNLHARVVLCGLISQYSENTHPPGPRNFVNLLMRRVRVQGFNVMDYQPRFRLASMRMLWWLLRGKVKDRQTIVDGLERAPEALAGMFKGDNIGKLIVRVADEKA